LEVPFIYFLSPHKSGLAKKSCGAKSQGTNSIIFQIPHFFWHIAEFLLHIPLNSLAEALQLVI
jgi:hypothetical protein